MKKRIPAFLLAALMLASAVSCSESGTPEDTAPAAATDAASVSVEETDALTETEPTAYELRQQISDDLPEIQFDGQSFRVMTHDTSYNNATTEILVEELSGDACNDAVFNRNLTIESRFGVKIECLADENPHDTIRTMVTSGVDACDIFGMFNYLAYYPINAEAVLNWKDVPGINYDKPWHNKLANTNATINDRLYAIHSDLAISAMTYTYAIFFNTELAQNYGYPSSSFYSLVNEGKWTLDRMIEITSSIYTDKNGDGQADMDDVYGFGTTLWNTEDVWLTAFDQPTCSITEDNSLELSYLTDKTVSILEKLLDFHYNNAGFLVIPDGGYAEQEYFMNNKLVMAPLRFYAAYNVLRDMESAYSILPYPKWDETQPAYYTNADDKFTTFAIPLTSNDKLDFIGVIYEALCAETYKKVYPEYYDVALKGKYSSEPETAEMIDLIMSGRSFDFAFQFGESHFQKLPYLLREMIQNNNPNISSEFKKKQKALKKSVENVLLPLYGVE